MSEEKLAQYTCTCCSNCKFHYDVTAMCKGVLLHPGECYCLGKKKPRKFKKSEQKKVPPVWCPKRKAKVIAQLYEFKSEQDAQMFRLFSDLNSPDLTPMANRYSLTRSWTSSVTAQEFYDGQELDVDIPMYAVIGFDDGLCVQYFFRRPDGYIYQPFFALNYK